MWVLACFESRVENWVHDSWLCIVVNVKQIIITGFATSKWIHPWLDIAVSMQAQGAWAAGAADACNTSLPRASTLIRQTECSPRYLHYLPVHNFAAVICCIVSRLLCSRHLFYGVRPNCLAEPISHRWCNMSQMSWIRQSIKRVIL